MTRRGLEQSTRESVADARARRFAELAAGSAVHDATCGLGSDALALSLAGLPVVAADLDPAVARLARANLSASPTPHAVVVADAARAAVRAPLLLLDPDRRPGASEASERTLDPRAWSPGVEALGRLLESVAGACLRLPAGWDIDRSPRVWDAGRPHAWQWVSAEGELSEVNLWLGSLAGCDPDVREVTLIPREGLAVSWRARPAQVVSLPPAEVSEIRWILDPDPAVVRAGLVGAHAQALGLRPIAPQSAYLVGAGERPRAALGSVWRVLDQVAADPKAVRRMLLEHDIGTVQVLKRGHPERSEELERKFAGRGRRRGTLVVARLEAGRRALLVERAGGVGDEGFEPPTSSL